jgi:hypothetical protein
VLQVFVNQELCKCFHQIDNKNYMKIHLFLSYKKKKKNAVGRGWEKAPSLGMAEALASSPSRGMWRWLGPGTKPSHGWIGCCHPATTSHFFLILKIMLEA